MLSGWVLAVSVEDKQDTHTVIHDKKCCLRAVLPNIQKVPETPQNYFEIWTILDSFSVHKKGLVKTRFYSK